MGVRLLDHSRCLLLQRLNVHAQFREDVPKKLTECDHVHGQNVKILGKVTLRKYVIDQMDHHLQCQFFIKSNHFENESCKNVESLTVACALVESGIGQKKLLENRMFFVRGETSVSRTMKVFDNLDP